MARTAVENAYCCCSKRHRFGRGGGQGGRVWTSTYTLEYETYTPDQQVAGTAMDTTDESHSRTPASKMWVGEHGSVMRWSDDASTLPTPLDGADVRLIDTLRLLRLLHAIAEYYPTLYDRALPTLPNLGPADWINKKFVAKLSRQIQVCAPAAAWLPLLPSSSH